MIRLFAAIAVPPAIAQGLSPLCVGLPGARWSPPENLHLTLRFVGEIAETAADDLDVELAAVCAAPLQIALAGVGVFEDGADARAVWVGVEASEPLAHMRRQCETAARRAGLAPDKRAWRPHVTLAYLRGAQPARVAGWIQGHNLVRPPPFTAAAFGLYSSWRTGRGAVYRLERSYSLAGK